MKQLPDPQSIADLDALLPAPGKDGYIFFEDAALHPFEKTLDFRHVNACWLIDVSYLSYATDAPYAVDRLHNAGLEGAPFGFDRADPPHILVAHNADVIIVAFRGTRIQDLPDILADISFVPALTGNGLVHSGFQNALSAGGVWDTAARHVAGIAGNQAIWFTGHSLGAALATLARRNYRDRRGRQQALYTFGSPRTGDQLIYCSGYPGNSYRIVNQQDAVPHVPTPPLYGHVGLPFGADGKPLDGSFWNDLEHGYSEIGSVLAVFSGASREMRLRDYFTQLPYKLLGDHAPKSYAAVLWNSLA